MTTKECRVELSQNVNIGYLNYPNRFYIHEPVMREVRFCIKFEPLNRTKRFVRKERR